MSEKLNLVLTEIGKRRKEATHPDLEYWGHNPPDEIIFATGSIRKAADLQIQLYGLAFPGESPPSVEKAGGGNSYAKDYREFYHYSNASIENGNYSLKKKTLIGYYHGVPVFAENSGGEGNDNDPVIEADNKAKGLLKKYAGKNVIIIGMDTVDSRLKEDGSNEFDWEKESLPKPINDKELPYPKDPVTEEEIVEYWKKYIEKYYPDGAISYHVSGISILNTAVDNDGEDNYLNSIKQFRTIFALTIIKDALEGVQGSKDSGGGGFIQEIINWDNKESLLEMYEHGLFGDNENLLKQYYETLDFDALKWRIICEVKGAPFMVFKYLDMVVEQRREKEMEGEEEQVIFDASKFDARF